MREVLSFLFDRITDPIGLPIAWYWEWIILAIIAFAAYAIAFRAVGDLYDGGMISGSTAGSILHWIIRLIVFVVIWAVTYFVIWLNVRRIVTDNPKMIEFTGKSGTSSGDAFLVATAMKYGLAVITEENPDKPTKIPQICKKYGLQAMNITKLCEVEGWKF